MSTAASHDLTVPLVGGRSHFLLRRLHSLTGIIFGGYLVVHLIVNATIAQLGSVFQVQVNKIHSLPFLWALEWMLIYLPIAYHTIYGSWIILTGQPNNDRYGYWKNWLYLFQRISAVIIVLFILFHVLSLKYHLFGQDLGFDPHNASFTINRHMTAGWWVAWLVYPLGVLASCYHLANGIWTAGVTWGLTVSQRAQHRWAYACLALFILTFSLGMTALVAAATMDTPPNAPVKAIAEPPAA